MLLRLLTYTYLGMAGAVIFLGKDPNATSGTALALANVNLTTAAVEAEPVSSRSATSPTSVVMMGQARAVLNDAQVQLIQASLPISASHTPAVAEAQTTTYTKGVPVSFPKPERGLISYTEPKVQADTAAADSTAGADTLYITGSRVNLRQGPGTDNAIVASLVLGTKTVALGAENDGWVMIRDTQTGTEGYMAARFLSPTRP